MMKPSITATGKPTEMTGVPQANKTRHSVMDGIVKGIPRGLCPPTIDGLVSGLVGKTTGDAMKVAPSATRIPDQVFGAVPYSAGK